MKITCISASNTKHMGKNSASTKVCERVKQMISSHSLDFEHSIEIVPLMDYDLRPCTLCGHCGKESRCIYQDGFNELYDSIVNSDLIFFVVPFYSVIPSKLTILFEKLNEILYSNWIRDQKYTPPFKGLPVAVIGHGGMPQGDKIIDYYHEHLVSPVARTLKSLSFNVISYNNKNGTAFGLENENCIKMDIPENQIFPDIIQNYDMIESTIAPFIDHVLKEVS